ncbi:hypothetical protein MTP10_09945 [Nonomuraea sp. 3-1Str]|uniref:hypothetical protein n=1 Tax=Nonomuraea sp. 3-1Str TaxID=2929801 RepID=UPI00285B6BCD|nr:hypothetical protein [Nonomuraea sp. 3-1Str]MDR8409060.1 hypothetical protein [Nonomuraea sp. 3-1Str]
MLTGPRGLTHAQIAEELSAVLGRTVECVALPPAELAAALRARGLPASFADDVTELSRQVATGYLAATTTAVQELTGRPPRTFAQFAAANAEALRTGLAAATS